MDIFEEIRKGQQAGKDLIKKSLAPDINEIVDEIKKAKSAQIGEIREWSGIKYKKGPNGWRPVGKEGGKKMTSISDEERKQNEAEGKSYSTEGKDIEGNDLGEHAKKAPESALINATKNSTDPAVREAAHKELARRENEEHNEMLKNPADENDGKEHAENIYEGGEGSEGASTRPGDGSKKPEKKKKEENPHAPEDIEDEKNSSRSNKMMNDYADRDANYSELSDEELKIELDNEEPGEPAYKKIKKEMKDRKSGLSKAPKGKGSFKKTTKEEDENDEGFPQGFDDENSNQLISGEWEDDDLKQAFKQAGCKVKFVTEEPVATISNEKGKFDFDFGRGYDEKDVEEMSKKLGLDIAINHSDDIFIKKQSKESKGKGEKK